ncbi:ras-specific guanine nucleotide-releasing factor 2 [Trichonephila clavipes]|nr:ras-specific guanine nucleotide-releasing factor 2 [Trichonephila clavipes]
MSYPANNVQKQRNHRSFLMHRHSFIPISPILTRFYKLHLYVTESLSSTFTHFKRNDPRLFKDDVDIRFSRTLNSCKLPQIRYASPERLFERLTDLRFLSIDFLNTFLLTYRVFTDGVTVLEALKKVHYAPEGQISASLQDSTGSIEVVEGLPGDLGTVVADYDYSRRISTVSTMSDIGDSRDNMESSLAQIQQAQQMLVTRSQQHWRLSHRKCKRRIGAREDTPLDCKYITV